MNDKKYYWKIRYEIEFLSDFHVGSGTILFGGNLHGVRRDENGVPYMPHTEAKGILRQRGARLQKWYSSFAPHFRRNFPLPSNSDRIEWSYTRATFPYNRDDISLWKSSEAPFGQQSHIREDEETESEKNLFSFQKTGVNDLLNEKKWQGAIYSVEPASEVNVAFMVASMRADDRVGRRRTRGYGKVNWTLKSVWRYEKGDPLEFSDDRSFDQWLELLFSSGGDQ